jgi:hypothetical protein
MVMAVNLADLVTDNTENTADAGTVEATAETPGTDPAAGEDTVTDETSEDSTISDDAEDVPAVPAWAVNQARKASLGKIININRFHSEVQASRAQAAVMLAKALQLEPVTTDENAFTYTILISPEDLGYILALKEAGIISGTPDHKFNPNSSVTRAEMAVMLANIADNIEDQEDETASTGDETTTDSSEEVSDTTPSGDTPVVSGDNTAETEQPQTGDSAAAN